MKRSTITASMNVRIVLRDTSGEVKEERRAHNLITDVGCAHIADRLASSHDETEMSHMAVGTGSSGPTPGDTTLGSELDRNALDSRTQSTGADDHEIVYVATWPTGDATGSLTEAGIFNAASGGVLLARVVFSVIEKGADEALEITWTMTISDDGA